MKQKSTIFYVLSLTISLLMAQFAYAEPTNLAHARNEVISYYNSGDYKKELTAVINQAKSYIDKRAQVAKAKHERLAIVLDIDETSLSNVKRIISENFSDDPAVVKAGILSANSPAISAMLNLYNDAKRQGIAIFFVTGRNVSWGKATKENLHKAGYNDWAGLYLRPDNYASKSISGFKSKARADIEKKGYIIVANIGDQQSDINGGFAEKGFKLPNPFYYLP